MREFFDLNNRKHCLGGGGEDNPLVRENFPVGKNFQQEKHIRKILVQQLTLKSSYVGPGLTSVVVLAER